MTGIARCAYCGGNMTHHSRSGSPDRYYRCLVSARRQQSVLGLTCTAHAAYAGDVEAITLAWLYGLAMLPDLASDVQKALAAIAKPSGPSRATVEEKLRRLARAYGDGAYTEAEYATRRADLMAQFEQSSSSTPIDISASAELLAQLPALMDEATPEERRAIVRQLVSEVYLYKQQVRALRPTGNTALFFETIDPARWLTLVQFGARSAPNEKLLQSLKSAPAILDWRR